MYKAFEKLTSKIVLFLALSLAASAALEAAELVYIHEHQAPVVSIAE